MITAGAKANQPPPDLEKSAAYAERKREAGRRYIAAGRAANNSIGPIPEPKNPQRRAGALKDYRRFKKEYHSDKFYIKPSADHKRLEDAIIEGANASGSNYLQAFAFPRATGKTTESWVGAMWGVLSGRKRFPLLIGASDTKATQMLTDICDDLQYNDALAEDFPEICYPLRALEGQRIRRANQTYSHNGDQLKTEMEWTDNQFILPWIRGWGPAQSSFSASGVLSKGLRGTHYYCKATNEIIRPDWIILDDIQNDINALSPSQCDKLKLIIEGAIKNMRGPQRPCSIFMPCTVIYEGDVADTYTDRAQKPQWRGMRSKMLTKMPTDIKLWEAYFEMRDELFAAGNSPTDIAAACNAYYEEHRKELDAGAQASWADNYDADEVSAVQHGMHLYHEDEHSFSAECQNEPSPLVAVDRELLPVLEIAKKTNGMERGVPPEWTEQIAGYVDIQKDYLYACVIAGGQRFAVIDYGPFPKQPRAHWSKKDQSLATYHAAAIKAEGKRVGWAKSLTWALEQITEMICGRTWTTAEGVQLKCGLLMIDARWGESTEIVKEFCRTSKHNVMPAMGFGFNTATRPIPLDKPELGVTVGQNWKIKRMPKWPIKVALIDTNRWKTAIHSSWKLDKGDPGSLELFEASTRLHQMWAEMQHAEHRTETTGPYGKVDIWKQFPHRPDNEGLDVAVGAMVGLSMLGVRRPGTAAPPPARRRKRVTTL